MNVYETALINKYHPVLNKADNDSTIDIIIKEPDWYLYKESTLKPQNPPKDFTNIKLTTSFKPKHFINSKSVPVYTNLNFPLMSVAEWKLLLILKLQLAPTTTRECIDFLYTDKSGERYNHIRKTADKLFAKDLCKLWNPYERSHYKYFLNLFEKIGSDTKNRFMEKLDPKTNPWLNKKESNENVIVIAQSLRAQDEPIKMAI